MGCVVVSIKRLPVLLPLHFPCEIFSVGPVVVIEIVEQSLEKCPSFSPHHSTFDLSSHHSQLLTSCLTPSQPLTSRFTPLTSDLLTPFQSLISLPVNL